jgi:hypothetical protein
MNPVSFLISLNISREGHENEDCVLFSPSVAKLIDIGDVNRLRK